MFYEIIQEEYQTILPLVLVCLSTKQDRSRIRRGSQNIIQWQRRISLSKKIIIKKWCILIYNILFNYFRWITTIQYLLYAHLILYMSYFKIAGKYKLIIINLLIEFQNHTNHVLLIQSNFNFILKNQFYWRLLQK